MDDKKITSIKIKNTSSGLISEDEISEEVLTIFRRGKIRHQLYNGLSDKPVKEYEYNVVSGEINKFFNSLTDIIKVNEWESDYRVPVCDGWYWELKIRCSDNSIKKVEGTVEPPPKGELLKKYILALADYKVEPWIL
jgi:hypothetical protein